MKPSLSYFSAEETTTLQPQFDDEAIEEVFDDNDHDEQPLSYFVPASTSEAPPPTSLVFHSSNLDQQEDLQHPPHHGIPRLVDSQTPEVQSQQPPSQPQNEHLQPQGIRSETARALNELGFSYEYIDDSDLLGDDSNNDEVIPAFHEDNYNQQVCYPIHK